MGAGVATSPHFPRIQSPYREGKVFFSWADRVLAEILRPQPVPSRVSCLSIAASTGPQRVLVEISLLRQSLFRGSFARKLQFHWTVWKVGAALTFVFASRFFLARPAIRFRYFHPFGCPLLPRRQRPKAFFRFRSTAPDHFPSRRVAGRLGYVNTPRRGRFGGFASSLD